LIAVIIEGLRTGRRSLRQNSGEMKVAPPHRRRQLGLSRSLERTATQHRVGNRRQKNSRRRPLAGTWLIA
jgi:hypothetical protein